MSIEHRLRQMAAHCLSALQRYQGGERSAAAKARMVAEVEVIIGWLMELDLSAGLVEGKVLEPVGMLLIDEYGPEVGGRLRREFVDVFEAAGMPLLFKPNYEHLKKPIK